MLRVNFLLVDGKFTTDLSQYFFVLAGVFMYSFHATPNAEILNFFCTAADLVDVLNYQLT